MVLHISISAITSSEGYAGLCIGLLNSLLLWLLSGFWQTRRALTNEPNGHKQRVMKRVSVLSIICAVIYSFAQCFLLSNQVIPHRLETTQCQIMWRVAFTSWMLQRYSICALSWLRLKFVFSDYRLPIVTIHHERIFLCVVAGTQLVMLTLINTLLNIVALPALHCVHCQPVLNGKINDFAQFALYILCVMIVAVTIALPLGITLYFALNLHGLMTLPDATSEVYDVRRLMVRVLATGFLSMMSGIIWLAMSIVTHSMVWLLIDSVVISLCVFISFRIEWAQLMRKYLCWPCWSRTHKAIERREPNRIKHLHLPAESRSSALGIELGKRGSNIVVLHYAGSSKIGIIH